jgi:hypothetical protein
MPRFASVQDFQRRYTKDSRKGERNMSRTSRFGYCALAVGFALVTRAAVAAEFGSFGYPPRAVFPSLGATTSGPSVTLPASDSPAFDMTFVLPQDYSRNGKVRVVVYLQLANNAATPCNMRLVPQYAAAPPCTVASPTASVSAMA